MAGLAALALGGVARTGHSAGMTSDDPSCTPVLAHALRPLTGGETRPLCERFDHQVLLIVNTASKCGFTPQFEALETLSERYADRGLAVLGFPSDDFNQELDEESDVAAFCKLNYGVSFPMFQKIAVSGADAHPLYRSLADATDGYPQWNFYKYLVDRQGRVVQRYASSVEPLGERLIADIESIL